MYIYSAQTCQTLGHPFDCSPPGSSVHGIFQTGKSSPLEWAAISFSKRSSRSGIKTVSPVSPYCRQILYLLSHRGSLSISDKGLISEIYKELMKRNTKVSNNSTKNWAKGLKETFLQRRYMKDRQEDEKMVNIMNHQ